MKPRLLIYSFACFIISFLILADSSHAQVEETRNGLSPQFAAQTKEISFICGALLPNQIEGITETMSMCGGRVGIRTSRGSFLEATVTTGAGRAQRYIMGSLGLRGDYGFDDLIASMFIGADIHYPTRPILDPATQIHSSDITTLYFGGHVGASLMAELSESVYFRSDLKFNFNPGTSLFLGFSIMLRFDAGGNQDNQNQ